MVQFRDLKSNEIDCRVSTFNENYLTILLYKDARVDQSILDETVKPENWQRDHKELKNNIYCGISIWDNEKQQWITKWDCGKESFTEAEKGEASDSFKRAGFNWGIGRELYTAPTIYIPYKDIEGKENYEIKTKNNKKTTYTKFYVEAIEITNKEIQDWQLRITKIKECFYIKSRWLNDRDTKASNNMVIRAR